MSNYSIKQFPRNFSGLVKQIIELSGHLSLTKQIPFAVYMQLCKLKSSFYIEYCSNIHNTDRLLELIGEYHLDISIINIIKDAYLIYRSAIPTIVEYEIFMRETTIEEKTSQTRGEHKKPLIRSTYNKNMGHVISPYIEDTIKLITSTPCSYKYTYDLIKDRPEKLYKLNEYIKLCTQQNRDTYMVGDVLERAKKIELDRTALLGDNYNKAMV